MSRYKIGIVDYGTGNHTSIFSAVKKTENLPCISNNIDVLEKCDLLLLPGVGAFPHAMKYLNELKISEYINRRYLNRTPIIGICLGMQILGDISYEQTQTQGLSIIPGKTEKIVDDFLHTGWNDVHPIGKKNLMADFCGADMYFNHSFVFKTDPRYVIATAKINESSTEITAAVQKDNVIGFQFHPEKSQSIGIELLSLTIKTLLNA